MGAILDSGVFPARVLLRQPSDVATLADRATRGAIRSTAELVALAKERAFDPSAFQDREPFMVPAEISSNRRDAYFTRMDPETTLVNYAADAADGVAVQINHSRWDLSLGRSLTGTLLDGTDKDGSSIKVVRSDFFIVPGMTLTSPPADEVILGIRTGVVADISVGFHSAQFRCSIDGLSLWDWDCPHIPGEEYEVRDGDKIVGSQLAEASVVNGRLSEYSVVYDGATPGAAVIKATNEAEAGRISPKTVRLIETRYRMRLPEQRVAVPGADVKKEVRSMDPETQNGLNDEQRRGLEQYATVRSALDGLRQSGEDDATAIRRLIGERQEARERFTGIQRALGAENQDAETVLLTARSLVSEAQDGRQYRSDTIDSAVVEYVRAFGKLAKKDEQELRSSLTSLPLSHAKRMTGEWCRLADAKAPNGRRSQDDVDHEDDESANRERRPSHAYR